MLTPKTLLAAVLAFTPALLFADPETDRQIEQTAKASYTFRRVLNNEIDVTVHDGIATLRGRVRDADQSRLAEDTIANLDGVRRVQNQITLDANAGGASDEWLAVKIRSKLLLKRDISLTHTRVDVRNGVVTLTGTAESEAQKSRTEAAIKEIAGVRQVRNHLEIASRTAQHETRPPRGEPPLPPGAGLPTGRDSPPARAAAAPGGDAAISREVKFRLLADEQTRGVHATIETSAGHVVLTGEAESAGQRERAAQVAREVRGVADVENRLSVKRP